jgi:NTP pyrophosphatase (non-canonical NTP hydrolase)
MRASQQQARLRTAAERAVTLWGREKQLRQLTEECGELIAAVNQHERGRITDDELAAEVADVLICIAQARYVIGQSVDAQVSDKLARLEQRIGEAIEERGGLYGELRGLANCRPENDNGVRHE